MESVRWYRQRKDLLNKKNRPPGSKNKTKAIKLAVKKYMEQQKKEDEEYKK